MKSLKLLVSVFILTSQVIGQQKPIIDTGMFNSWPAVSQLDIYHSVSEDGKYFSYVILNQPTGKSTLVIQNLVIDKKICIVSMRPRILTFSCDNKHLYWQQGDTIWQQETESKQNKILAIANTFSYSPNLKGKWIALLSDNDSAFRLFNLITGVEKDFSSIKSHEWVGSLRKLVLYTSRNELKVVDLESAKEQLFKNVKHYELSEDEKTLTISALKDGSNSQFYLQQLDLITGDIKTIWKGHVDEIPGDFLFGKLNGQFAFSVQAENNSKAIWYYEFGQPQAVLKVNDDASNLKEFKISGIRAFSENRQWLFFNVRKELPQLELKNAITQVDIWSYRDEVLNPAQSKTPINFRDYVAVANVKTGNVRLLEQSDDESMMVSVFSDYQIIRKGSLITGLGWWPHKQYSECVVSLVDGKRKQLDATGYFYSPDGRWFYNWNEKMRRFYFVNPVTQKETDPAFKIAVDFADDIQGETKVLPVGVAGWYKKDSAVLVYDNFDIWKLDPTGMNKPINLTNGYGKLHGIKLRLLDMFSDVSYLGNEELLLAGLDVKTRFNGFFKIKLDNPGNPEMLTFGPYHYYNPIIVEHSSPGMKPLCVGLGKHKRWIVMRESATSYPNFYESKDLKSFTPISDLQPQKAYNWVSTEPIRWRMFNGQLSTGVLYKPENFDSTKKYPVIFNYYEKLSQRCYEFLMPGLTTDNIDIPWFVSRGYIVFTPDIQYNVASNPSGMTTSEAAYNAVASAAEFLSLCPYVDKSKMAIQGHSFGGHETNAIITQTNLFAAAAEMAGFSDHISSYLTLVGYPVEKNHHLDHHNQRMGATPWERPDLYRKNSPVLNADKITTPLFIVHNKKDAAVNYNQGIEMYMALRRLGKTVWLLQYDNSGHVLDDERDALDYTIRLTQYFDHYLKGAPAPQWMTMNTLAPYKGKNNLYRLDLLGNCSKDCRVCKMWNEKWGKDSVATMKEIEDRIWTDHWIGDGQ